MRRVIILQKLFPMRQAIKAALAAHPPDIDYHLPKDEDEAERLIAQAAGLRDKLLVITGYQRWNVRYGDDVVRTTRVHDPSATILICSGQSESAFAHLRNEIDGTINRNPVAIDQLVRFWAQVPNISDFADKIPGLRLYDRTVVPDVTIVTDDDSDVQSTSAAT